ncbi:endonuclease G [Aquimarina sp. MAR_2010_214]|uniref:DNA/RNA non-specific endonuclease n=1 Tax=Aquimarina sp. MAR_2010_214 TaxID=1250026 RepID=UPI000C70D776|nr:DNA/RNA non-specific endonuclease [Aquimarina sp. MAR_2010_214]PKV49345.1 endonuclease G [Aquimarina sp. MAR_2010_214]
MKRKYIYPMLIIIVTIGFYYFEGYIDNKVDFSSEKANNTSEYSFYYLPTSTTGAIIVHDFYALSYSEKHEQAEWVAYELKKEHLSKNEFKRPFFEEDRKVKSLSADWRNYKNSGFDRGHLCPAGDRRFTYEAFEETFFTSNVAPQNHEFNSGIWNRLEQKVRYWAKIYDGVYIVTGGVLVDDLSTIGYEHISIPKHFYKIILDNTGAKPKIIAFLIPHKDVKTPLKEFVVSVDKIEKLTGIDFFETLDDKIENQLESSSTVEEWKF